MTPQPVNDTVVRRSVRTPATVVWREIGGVLVVRDMRSSETFHLTDSTARVWRLIDEYGDVQAVIDQLRDDFRTDDVERDVRDFIAAAHARHLLEDIDRPAPAPARVDGRPLQLGRTSIHVAGDVSTLQKDFERRHYVCLPHLIEPALLQEIAACVDGEHFTPRTHEGIGSELHLANSPLAAALQLLFNDPRLLHAMEEITGCRPLRCFDGRVYRMLASEGHYDSWHSDAGKDRRVAVSVNLTREPYDGGLLEIRHASSRDAESVVPRMPFGGAVMFRISPDLRHRVTPVSGTMPRTAYAGWFCSSPDFQEQYFSQIDKK
jgi:hypothetical protein